MGNSLKSGGSGRCKVILSDSQVVTKEVGSSVAELMMDHPNHFVAELRAFLASSTRPPALPADRPLQKAQIYLMVCMKSGRAPVSSAAHARRLLSKSRWKTKKISPPEAVSFAKFDNDDKEDDDSARLTSRNHSARSSRHWKPSLDPIQEKSSSSMLPRWLT